MISEQAKQRMRELAERYPVPRSAIMPSLHIAQEAEGYVSAEGLQAVAEVLRLTVHDVESVASFYTMYYPHPKGKKVIKVCTSISCYLRNCDSLMAHIEQRLGIKAGETTSDGRYTLMGVECIAACSSAPALQVNDEFVENVTFASADALIDELDRELNAQSSENY